MYVEGLVHITELGGEYFRFDEARQELRGERTGTRYAIGTRVRIQVSRVDLDGRKIDFRLVNEGMGLAGRPPAGNGDKAVLREGKVRPAQAERFELDGGGRAPSFKAELRKRSAAKSGRAPKSASSNSAERPAAASKKAARKKR
jgi:ribonuclease R